MPGPPPESITRSIAGQVTRGLGDTDLVEAILSPTGEVRQLALALIAEQTGWTDIAIVPIDEPSVRESNPPRQESAAVEIIFNTLSFGVLTTARARVGQLRPWADWLGRWLALDQAHRDHRLKSFQDDLTGAWNRRFFDAFLGEAIDHASAARRPVTIMVFDIDNFKTFNDHFGHEAGDEILCETVRLLTSVIRQGDRVCRIGGDEFAVVFADPEAPRTPGSTHPESVERIAKRFQDQVCTMRFPKLGAQAPGSLSISAGLATFPWDGHDPQTLLRRADQLALESKRKGKNHITFGPGALQVCKSPPGGDARESR
jgi:diguanylate cyclase (GGDEF)-like protein